MNPIIDKFFSLGEKVSKGDPVKKARFDYYLLWVMFMAFIVVLVGYIKTFLSTGHWQYIGWAIFVLCILWFQYFGLMGARKSLELFENFTKNKTQKAEEKIESPDEMLKEFDNNINNEKGGRDAKDETK